MCADGFFLRFHQDLNANAGSSRLLVGGIDGTQLFPLSWAMHERAELILCAFLMCRAIPQRADVGRDAQRAAGPQAGNALPHAASVQYEVCSLLVDVARGGRHANFVVCVRSAFAAIRSRKTSARECPPCWVAPSYLCSLRPCLCRVFAIIDTGDSLDLCCLRLLTWLAVAAGSSCLNLPGEIFDMVRFQCGCASAGSHRPLLMRLPSFRSCRGCPRAALAPCCRRCEPALRRCQRIPTRPVSLAFLRIRLYHFVCLSVCRFAICRSRFATSCPHWISS